MSIPGSVKAFSNVTRWCQRDEWADGLMEWVGRHSDSACALLDLDPELLEADALPELYECFLAFATTDFLASGADESGRNPVDEYLKRRGWKETAGGRRFLQAFRTSRPSLYEIVDLKPGESLTLRDLLRGGAPFTAEDSVTSKLAPVTDRVVARVVTVGERHAVSGAVLPMDSFGAEAVICAFEGERDRREEQGRSTDWDDILAERADMFGAIWLTAFDNAGLLFGDGPFGDDSPESVYLVKFAIRGSEGEIAALLDRRDEFERRDGSDLKWTWRSPAPEDLSAEADGDLGGLALFEGTLHLAALDEETALRGEALIAELLREKVGAGEFSQVMLRPDDDEPPRLTAAGGGS